MSPKLTHADTAARIMRQARLSVGLTLRELAAKAETSHATLSAYEQGRKVPAITTFLRVLEACGNAVDIQLQRRIQESDGILRGEELEAVLKLAAQFPVTSDRRLNLPVFPND